MSESYLCFVRSLAKEGIYTLLGKISFLGGSVVKNPSANAGDLGSIPGSGRSPGEGTGNPFQYSCFGGSHGQRNVVGYSPWGPKESDTTEQLTDTHEDGGYVSLVLLITAF